MLMFSACVDKPDYEKQAHGKTNRCVVQLTVLGYVLVPVFAHNTWYVVLAYSSLMLLVAAAEAAGRPSYSCKVCVHGMYRR